MFSAAPSHSTICSAGLGKHSAALGTVDFLCEYSWSGIGHGHLLGFQKLLHFVEILVRNDCHMAFIGTVFRELALVVVDHERQCVRGVMFLVQRIAFIGFVMKHESHSGSVPPATLCRMVFI